MYDYEEAVRAIEKLILQTHRLQFMGVPPELKYDGPELTHCLITATTPKIGLS